MVGLWNKQIYVSYLLLKKNNINLNLMKNINICTTTHKIILPWTIRKIFIICYRIKENSSTYWAGIQSTINHLFFLKKKGGGPQTPYQLKEIKKKKKKIQKKSLLPTSGVLIAYQKN